MSTRHTATHTRSATLPCWSWSAAATVPARHARASIPHSFSCHRTFDQLMVISCFPFCLFVVFYHASLWDFNRILAGNG